MKNYLNFESDIKNLEDELDKLKDPYNQSGLSEVDTQKISQIQNELDEKLKMVYANLDPWQTTMVARHEDRPKSKFFIDNLFEDFIPLSGDRFYGEDLSLCSECLVSPERRQLMSTGNLLRMPVLQVK